MFMTWFIHEPDEETTEDGGDEEDGEEQFSIPLSQNERW